MQLIDERAEIKHACHSMQLHKLFLLFLAGGLALRASAQPATNTNPPSYTNAAATVLLTNLPPRAERVVSLPECIQLALSNNLAIQIARYSPIINSFALNIAYDVYEPTFSFTGSKSYSSSPGSFFAAGGTNFAASQSERDTYTPDISGSLPTGMKYDFNGPWTRISERSPDNTHWLSPSWQSSPGAVTLDQPLLKNFWIDQQRLSIQVDKATLRNSVEQLRLTMMSTVTSVKTAYYNLISARLSVDADAKAYELAKEQADDNRLRVQIGTMAPLDQRQAESQAAASLTTLLAAQNTLVTQENTLKSLLTQNYSEWQDVTPRPAESTLVAVPRIMDRQDSWRTALAERPEYIQAKIAIEKQNVTLKFDYNQGFPQLDLTGTYGRSASNPSFSGNLNDIANGENSSYSYGISFSYPLGGNQAARNTYKSDKASLKQLILQLKQQEQSILVAVENDLGQVQSTYQQVMSTHAATLYAEDALAAEKIKYENGTSTSFNVLQLISNQLAARLSEIQALATYNNALAQLDLDEGFTLKANHIDFKVK